VKERLITFVCASGALALFFTMFMHKHEPGIGGREIPIGEGYRALLQAYLGDKEL